MEPRLAWSTTCASSSRPWWGDQILGGALPLEEIELDLAKGQVVSIAICNWLGAFQASVSWEFTYVVRGKKGGHRHH